MRGDNPNSRRNLAKGTPFNAETARKAQAIGAEKKRALAAFRELDAENTTDDERLIMLQVLKKKAMAGNLQAFKIYYKLIAGKEPPALIPTDDELAQALESAAQAVFKDE